MIKLRFGWICAAAWLLGSSLASGREFVLTDTAPKAADVVWSISNAELGIAGPAFRIRQRRLHGGREEGVELLEVDNGTLAFSVIPTRGMSIYRVATGDVVLGWDSPVKEIVHPAFIELQARGGLGWLDGFNEFLVRCGVEWAGHPGMDDGKLLSLHGRIGNIPASRVIVVVEDQPPHRIRVRGRVVEQTFKFTDYELWTEISTEPGTRSFRISDVLTNRSDYEREFQIIYHGNFGPPLLEEGAKFVGAARQVRPFDDYAAKDMATWTAYRGPTKGYGEQVYVVMPFAREDGVTAVMLQNATGERGIRLQFNVNELPCFTLWKNTDTLKEGYVTGLEPGTGSSYPRATERALGRVPKLAPGASRSFTLDYTVLTERGQVEAVAREIAAIQGSRATQLDATPPKP